VAFPTRRPREATLPRPTRLTATERRGYTIRAPNGGGAEMRPLQKV